MTFRLSDLSSKQIRRMVKIDDSYPHEDSVGMVEHEMMVGEFG